MSGANGNSPVRNRAGAVELPRLLKPVFDLDLEHCPACGVKLKIVDTIADLAVMRRV